MNDRARLKEAMLKAADHIEKNPNEFLFSVVRIPDGPGCGSPGCAIGWTCYFYGNPSDNRDDFIDFVNFRDVMSDILGVQDAELYLYEELDKIEMSAWMYRGQDCARTLRKFVEEKL